MLNSQHTTGEARQQLSALMDGELDPADWGATCDACRVDGRLRADWHAWHLIGDTMRSDELAAEPRRDNAFLQGFRERLATEPVVLAPMAAVAPATETRRLHWLVAPGAVAAGFMVVAGAMLVLRPTNDGGGASSVVAASASGPVGSGQIDAEAIRDARLDRYLTAHRRLAGSAAMVVPGGGVRNVDVLAVEAK